jgi:C-3',4' desaturase CrtD
LLRALRPDTLVTLPHTFRTVGQALRSLGLAGDRRLKTFLDLQLKLYSQVDGEETALLYAATALRISQAPYGLFHLQGSMQELSDRLEKALVSHGGLLQLRHTVTAIHSHRGRVQGVRVQDQKTGQTWVEPADQVVANVTVQNLVTLLGEGAPRGYRRRVESLPPASGAFVIYLGVAAAAIPPDCPPHLQFFYDYDGPMGENNSLFVSVSRPGDGRAPQGQATIVASSFTAVEPWWQTEDYPALKQRYSQAALKRLGGYFDLRSDHILHLEAATPRSFAHFTGRHQGMVGGWACG